MIKEIFKRLSSGIEIASKSFLTISKNKKLLLYFSIPILLITILEIISYNTQKFSAYFNTSGIAQDLPENILLLIKKIGLSSGWLKYAIIGIIYFIHVAVITLSKMAITYHSNNIQNNLKQNFKNAYTQFIKKIKISLAWTSFIFIPIFIFQAIGSINEIGHEQSLSIFYLITTILIYLAWTLTTTFVIQSLTIEKIGILEAVDKSINAIRKGFFQYLGAMFWISALGTIAYLPFAFIDNLLSGSMTKNIYVTIYSHISIIAIIFISCGIKTAYEVCKTTLYNKFK